MVGPDTEVPLREKAKLIIFAALSAALTVAGLSIAAGGSNGSGGSGGSSGGSGTQQGLRLHREFAPPGGQFDSNVADVLRQIHDAVEQKAPSIADPIIQKAQDDGKITSSQADQLRALTQARADEKPPAQDPRALFGDSDVRAVLQDVFKATAQQAPSIAEPIIQKAVDDKKITSAQADDIRSHLKDGPKLGPMGPGFGFGHREGPGRPFGPHVFGAFDKDVATVLGDIHQAVEKQAPAIADPVIKKAQDDGKITSSQADQLRAAAQAIADGKRPDANVRTLLSDADVRQVVHDAFAAAAKQTPSIAEPIIKKAVDDKKITSSQADQIRSKLNNLSKFRAGPPPFGAPGGPPHWEGRGRLERPQGNAPGVFPGGQTPGAGPAVQPGPALSPA
jgi:hypothetical protein